MRNSLIKAGTNFRVSYNATPDYMGHDLHALVDIDLKQEFESELAAAKKECEDRQAMGGEFANDGWDDCLTLSVVSALAARLVEEGKARDVAEVVFHLDWGFGDNPKESIEEFLNGNTALKAEE